MMPFTSSISNALSFAVVHMELLTIFLFLFATLGFSFASEPQPQGSKQWHMTSDVREIAGKSYDYIIVGGGTSGCPLAATLSEKFSVLVVERGGSPYGNPLVTDKSTYGFALLETDKYSSIVQSLVTEDGVNSARGRILGGSSSINGGLYSRASQESISEAGWDKEQVKEAYEWVESKVVFPPMSLSPWQSAVNHSFVEAGVLPYNGFSLEHIKGTKYAASVFDGSGKRHPSADLLDAGNPKNLNVLLNATVKSIMFHHIGETNKTRAHGIRFMQSNGSLDETYEAYIKEHKDSTFIGDVILSAGAMGSPQILLLSGIGPEEHLRRFNIPLVLDLTEVGKGMQDNPSISILLDAKPMKRLPDPPLVAAIADDFKIIVEGGIEPISTNGTTRVSIYGKLPFPSSKGMLELNDTDPRLNPLVRFNYLSTEADMEQCIKMVRLLKRMAETKSIALFFGPSGLSNLTSIEPSRKFCKENVETFYHFHGGCLVGSVVNEEFRVQGIKGLRVLDASTLSVSPGTNPMATLLMLGRYLGVKIQREAEQVLDLPG